MASRTRIASKSDLLRLTQSANVRDLEAKIVGHTTYFSGHGSANVSPDDEGAVVYVKTILDERGFDLRFPFYLAEFWQAVETVDGYLAESEADNLPFAGDLEQGSTDEDRLALFETLAANWRLDHSELIDIIGGGWKTLDIVSSSNVLDEDGDIAQSPPVWLGAGDPLLVAIGITGA